MSSRHQSDLTDADPNGDTPDTTFQLAAAVHAGVLVAGLAAAVVATTAASSTALLGTAAIGFVVGTLVGVGLSRRVRKLPSRLGRTRRRRLIAILPAVPFGAAVIAATLGPLDGRFGAVAICSTVGVLVSGYVLSRVAQTRYVAVVTDDEPIAAWEWEPPGSTRLTVLLLVLWLFLAASNAYTGDWAFALSYAGLGLLWAVTSLAEGRFRIGSTGSMPEIRVHDAGLVKKRPYTASLVPWDEVDHVHLRNDELVLDRGLFDVRFGRDELDDLEGALAAVERGLSDAGARQRG